MILPSDDDPRSRRDDDPEPPPPFGDSGHIPPWLDPLAEDDDDDDDDDGDEEDEDGDDEDEPATDSGGEIFGFGNGMQDDDEDGPFEGAHFSEADIQSPAAPGWRSELRDELIAAINDLRDIEDPTQDFDPPDPPDLFTFFGEMAALRHELRRSARRSNEGIEATGDTLRRLTHGVNDIVRAMGHATTGGPAEGSRGVLEQAVIDLHDQVNAVVQSRSRTVDREALATTMDALLAATGITRIPIEPGDAVDAVKMKIVAREKGHGKKNTVLRVDRAGFMAGDRLLRPAQVVVIGRP